MKIKKYCRCGAAFNFSGSAEELAEALLAMWRKEHDGDGHGDCDAATASRARQKADRDEP